MNVFALLPEPGGDVTGIVIRNQAGSQELMQANQAVRVDRADVAPGSPYALTDPDVRRLFGSAIDALPAPELVFLLHFDEGSRILTADSQAKIPAIINAIRERSSTSITVTGHTDTIDTPVRNYQVGLERAQNVAKLLLEAGVKASDLSFSSHGDTDLLMKTDRGVPNAENRRVEVIVR
jgi:outer membrane protein OmpA-like peptidoglycan-associated protein